MQISSNRILHEGRFLETIESTVIMGNDPYETPIRYEWVRRANNTRAVVMPCVWVNPDDNKDVRLVITHESRVPLGDKEWGFPAGLQDKSNESPADTAKREVKEETGLDVVEVFAESPWIYSSSGLTNECVKMVYCMVTGYISNNHQEEYEEISTFLYNREEVASLLRQEHLFGAKAWIIMTQFASTGTII